MKRILVTFLLTLGMIAPLLAQGLTEPLSVAVIDFQTSGEKLDKKGAEVAVLLGVHLSASPNLILVERQEIEKILSEQELGLSGTVTPDSAAKVGALTGAKVLIMGRLFDSGGQYYLVAKIMSTETSRVYGEMTKFDDLANLDQAATELAGKISDVASKRIDTLLAKAETPEERLARLKKLVEGRKLPSVFVQVTERHINHAVIDPAVQTEMMLTLQQLGFEVLPHKEAGKRPEVVISGEAFSELGMRRGNLVSCRARVEIKVTPYRETKLIAADRQTDVAVDLSESVAGKKALEHATSKLLDRLIPMLVSQK